jgi:outer membrane protein TolC
VARVQAALARLDQAAAARWPSVSLSASLGLRSLTLGSLLDGSVANALLASLAVPLFDGGALAAQQRAQAAALEQSRAQWTGTVLAALKDVENALLALRQDAERLQHLQAAATAARNAELMAQYRFRSGVIDFRTVLDAQRATLSTQDAVEVQRATLLADQVRLMQALGGNGPAL